MAYSETPITAITDIPALVATFAAAQGWTVAGSNYTRSGGGLTFTLGASISGYDHVVSWTNGSNAARIVSPKLNGTASAPVVTTPSKLYLFGTNQFIAIVIEYGFNQYRHLYLGNMVKAGGYTGGEVISGCTPLATANAPSFPLSYRSNAYLFGARQTVHANGNAGGVNVAHADNPTTWRQFRANVTYPSIGAFDNATALGGYGDDINDGYLARGRSSYAGSQILVPVNLYATLPITGDTLFVPLGAPAGVRMVNMADIDPAGIFTIGSDDWQVFPAFTKTTATAVAQGGTAGWAASETSYLLGYAYPR